jgi:hypothetical protein
MRSLQNVAFLVFAALELYSAFRPQSLFMCFIDSHIKEKLFSYVTLTFQQQSVTRQVHSPLQNDSST